MRNHESLSSEPLTCMETHWPALLIRAALNTCSQGMYGPADCIHSVVHVKPVLYVGQRSEWLKRRQQSCKSRWGLISALLSAVGFNLQFEEPRVGYLRVHVCDGIRWITQCEAVSAYVLCVCTFSHIFFFFIFLLKSAPCHLKPLQLSSLSAITIPNAVFPPNSSNPPKKEP